ncbi:ABC transporter substrate-binding protein [Gammaproteobacteria bacterium]|nr:ABC transporter substrate-binding protein [Gammaproteobacteria bacterium]
MKDKIIQRPTVDEISYCDLDANDRNLVEHALKQGFSRRQVLKLMMATGVTMTAASNIFTTGGQAMAQTPKKGGKIKFCSDIHGPNDQMDPVLFTSGIDYTRGRATYNSLVQHDEFIVPQPELAEEFSPNADATEWTFKLRKGVVWHDGSPFTADDVVWSMNRHMGEDSKSVVKAVIESVTEWKKIDSYTVKAILSSPNADIATILGMFQFKIVKKDTVDFAKGIGTGPYTLTSFEPGVGSTHKRNENYWRDGANLDEVEIFAITDTVARVSALISDDVQLAQSIDPKAIRQVEAADNVDLLSVPGGKYMGFVNMKNTLPGSNDDFVKGMQYIQRRDKIVKSFLKGHGTVGNDQPINAAYGTDHCSELAQRPFDPDKAKSYFKKAGINSAEIHLAEITAGIGDATLLMQRELSKIGFDLSIKKVPNDGYWGAVWMKTPINVVTWNMRPTANSMLSIAFAPGAAWNDTQWNNDRMGELLVSSRGETDPAKRHQMYCEMQTLVNEECGMVIPAHSNYIDGKSKKLHGVPKVPLGQMGASEWPEFVWLDA